MDYGSDGGDEEQWSDLRYITSLLLMACIKEEGCEGKEGVRLERLKELERGDVYR